MIAAPNLQAFQQQFGHFLRHQSDDDSLAPIRVGKLYQSLIFNSVMSFPNQCFPICQALLNRQDETLWQTLCCEFFKHQRLHSPFFTHINADFVQFLSDTIADNHCSLAKKLPEFLADLAHYEWIELAIDIAPNGSPKPIFGSVCINPTLQNLHYDYAVQNATIHSQTLEKTPTFLAAYRQNDHHIEILQTNALTYLLIDYLQTCTTVYDDNVALLNAFFDQMNMPVDESVMDFGQTLLDDFFNQEILLKKESYFS